jgi:hypothetical protein
MTSYINHVFKSGITLHSTYDLFYNPVLQMVYRM